MGEQRGDNVVEWQIESLKKYATKLKEEEIEHSSLTPAEKDDKKRLWKQCIDETTKGFKEVLRREGRKYRLWQEYLRIYWTV